MNPEKIKNDLLKNAVDEKGESYLKLHFRRYLETIKLIPVNKKLRVLDIGTFLPLASYLKNKTPHVYYYHSYPEGSLKNKKEKYMGKTYDLVMFDVEKDNFPYKENYFDYVLCGEVLEHLGLDPMHMLSEVNRVLKPNGRIFLSTPNITSLRSFLKILLGYSPYLYASFTLNHDRHNREYSPREVRQLLEISGFKIEKLFTKNTYFEGTKIGGLGFFPRIVLKVLFWIGNFGQMRGDCIFAVAKKRRKVLKRYPEEFYDFSEPAKLDEKATN